MKIEKILAWIGGFFLAKMAVEQLVSAAFNRVQYEFGNPSVNMQGLGLNPPTVRVNLPMTITNNNSVGLQVTNLVGSLYYGNVKLSDVTIPAPANIPANGAGQINLAFDVQALNVLNDIFLSLNQTGTYSTLVNVLKLKGNLETNLLRVPIETNISLV